MTNLKEIDFFSFLGGEIELLKDKYNKDAYFRYVVDCYHELLKVLKEYEQEKPRGITIDDFECDIITGFPICKFIKSIEFKDGTRIRINGKKRRS